MEKKISELLTKIYDEAFCAFELYCNAELNDQVKKRLKKESFSQMLLYTELIHEITGEDEELSELANTLQKLKGKR